MVTGSVSDCAVVAEGAAGGVASGAGCCAAARATAGAASISVVGAGTGYGTKETTYKCAGTRCESAHITTKRSIIGIIAGSVVAVLLLVVMIIIIRRSASDFHRCQVFYQIGQCMPWAMKVTRAYIKDISSARPFSAIWADELDKAEAPSTCILIPSGRLAQSCAYLDGRVASGTAVAVHRRSLRERSLHAHCAGQGSVVSGTEPLMEAPGSIGVAICCRSFPRQPPQNRCATHSVMIANGTGGNAVITGGASSSNAGDAGCGKDHIITAGIVSMAFVSADAQCCTKEVADKYGGTIGEFARAAPTRSIFDMIAGSMVAVPLLVIMIFVILVRTCA